MNIFKNKTFLSYIIILLGLMFIEITFRIISDMPVFNISLFRIFLSSLLLSAVLGFLTSLTRPRLMHTLNLLIIFLASIYAFVQLGFNLYIGVYLSVKSSSQLGAVKNYIIDFIKAIKPSYYLIFLPFLILTFGIILASLIKKKKPEVFKLKRYFYYQNTIMFLNTLIIVTLCMGGYYYFLDDNFIQDKYQAVSNKDLFLTGSNSGLCVKEFGVISYGFIDTFTKYKNTNDETIVDFAYDVSSVDDEDLTRTFDDTTWKLINADETIETFVNLNNYFMNNRLTHKNDFTGLFENKNLIVIMMESVSDIIYDEKYFPNFYKLATEGWYFENNYSPRNSCATGNNEFSALNSLYSIYNVCTANEYASNKYPESLFNLFREKGYKVTSFHDYDDTYYARTLIHPNLGAEKYYEAADMGMTFDPYYGQWPSDEEMIDYYLEHLSDLSKGEQFMSFLTTVTSHQPYNMASDYGDKYYDMTEDKIEWDEDLRRYYSKLKVLDNALGKLVEGLEERNLLKDTVIVLFGDHYPYGLSDETLAQTLTRDLKDNEVEKVPLVIYNPDMEAQVNTQYTSYINLTPTLANLFDLDYDPRLYIGTDIFSSDYENLVVFADSSWKNEKAYYNALSGTVTYYTDDEYSEVEIKNINAMIYSKINASSLAIRNNYFEYIYDQRSIYEKGNE